MLSIGNGFHWKPSSRLVPPDAPEFVQVVSLKEEPGLQRLNSVSLGDFTLRLESPILEIVKFRV